MSISAIPWAERIMRETAQMSADDAAWRQFVMDHRMQLRQAITGFEVPPEHIDQYKYRPVEYLNEQHQIPVGHVWMTLIVSELIRYEDFGPGAIVYVVPEATLATLWKQFETSQHEISQADSTPPA